MLGKSSRSPLGLRGLKYKRIKFFYSDISRSPLGLRGLKCVLDERQEIVSGRSPLGLRGLKYLFPNEFNEALAVAALLGCVD